MKRPLTLFAGLLALLGLASGFLRPSEAGESDETCPISPRGGLQVWYDFASADGDVVHDRAGVGEPLDLRIETPKAVSRGEGALEIRRPARIRSQGPARRLTEAITQTGAATIEAWVRPASEEQSGPARIVTLSENSGARNFTLGQDGRRFDVRFRSSESNANGIPSLSTKAAAADRLAHVVYTRDPSGAVRLFVDGEQKSDRRDGGGLGNWDPAHRLALANEISGDRPWLGTLYRVAIYNRALSPAEIEASFREGLNRQPPRRVAQPAQELAAARTFQTGIAPLLARHCLECHDAASNEGGLDLSHRKQALAGGDSGEALVPGNSSESLLWEMVASDAMPLDRPPLSDEEKTRLKAWIDAGAEWTDEFIDPAVYAHAGGGDERWVQRLTVQEYIDTVRAAVGVDIAEPARRLLPPDARADGFANTAYNLTVDLGHVEAYAKLAEMIVDRMDVVAFATRFHRGQKPTDKDMRALVEKMGRWILRGPLEEHELATYRGISTTVAGAGGDYEEAVRYILIAMLQSPRFLYRVENQVGQGGTEPVSAYELASRLGYLVWGAPPDESLMKDAESGRLLDCDVIESHVQRMLEDPRAAARSRQFVRQWLNLDRLDNLQPNAERFPGWSPDLAIDMRRETLAVFDEIVWRQRRPLTDLLDAQVTFVTPRLAAHYGLENLVAEAAPEAPEDELVRIDLRDVPSRGGLLTHGSLLTIGGDDASMVTRGLFVLHDLLFSEVGDPPPGLDTTPVPATPGRSRRMIAMERVESASCGGCHSRFEPLAFGLERYDGLGAYAERDEHGNRLRQDGEILFPGQPEPVTYQSTGEMMDLLADSDRVALCLTRKLIQFSLGRPLVVEDLPAIDRIHRTAQQNGGTYPSLITAIAMSELIQTQRTEPH